MTLGLDDLARRQEEAHQRTRTMQQYCQDSEALCEMISTLHDRTTR